MMSAAEPDPLPGMESTALCVERAGSTSPLGAPAARAPRAGVDVLARTGRPARSPSPARGEREVVLQLDLFGEAMSPDRQRHIDALVCLRDAMSDALEIVVALRYGQPRENRSPRAAGDWAFCVQRAGLRYEAADDWWSGARDRGETYGWNRMPARLVTWAELTALVGQDPRRAEVAAWVDSLPQPRWRMLMRPHELWPDPGWHISYLCHDHVDTRWTGRRRAWQLVLDLLTDAIGKLRTTPDLAGATGAGAGR